MNASDTKNDLHRDFIAVLDDVELERDHDGYRYPSGEKVPDIRVMDIVFVNAKTPRDALAPPVAGKQNAWWSGLSTAALDAGVVIDQGDETGELDDILAALGDAPPELSIDIEPDFFHSTLSQWMGQGRVQNEAPLWDYAFWKAELQSEGRENDREVFSAQVFRGHSESPETYRYALRYEGKSVAAAEWLSERPDLLKSDDEFDQGSTVSDSALLAIMND